MAQLYVLLCDDDPFYAKTLAEHVSRCFVSREINVSTQICSSVSELNSSLGKGAPDLLFLDLTLVDGDGYAVAEDIRRLRLKTEIVFVTSHAERMSEAFPYRPIGFLSKPSSPEQIDAVIERFLFFYYQDDTVYTVSNRETDMRIPLHNIVYFESSAHRVIIHLANGRDDVSQTRRLDDIDAELSSLGFTRVHQSFLVRMDAIERIDRTHMRVALINGRDLPISRSRYASVMEQFIHHRVR